MKDKPNPLGQPDKLFASGDDLQLWGDSPPPPQNARNPVEEPEGIDKPGTRSHVFGYIYAPPVQVAVPGGFYTASQARKATAPAFRKSPGRDRTRDSYTEVPGYTRKNGGFVMVHDVFGEYGIVTSGDIGDRPRDPSLQGKPPGVVSLTTIEVQDVICEGPIEGLASGQFELSGTEGEIGYSSAIFTPFVPIVAGTLGTSNAHPSGVFRSIFYNNVEIIDKNLRKNFQNVSVSFNNGTPGGNPLVLDAESNRALEVVRNIGERLRGPEMRYRTSAVEPTDMELIPGQDQFGRSTAKFYRIENKNCTSFRINVKVPSLGQVLQGSQYPATFEGSTPQDIGRGDNKSAKVLYGIDYRPLFNKESKNTPFSTKLTDPTDGAPVFKEYNVTLEEIFGKVSQGYIRSTHIVIDKNKYADALRDPDFLGWEIMIARRTPDSYTNTLRNQTIIDSIVEGFEESFGYPNTAIVRSRFSADSFQQVPARAFKTKLLKVKIPNNYNPILKTYGATRGGSSVTHGGDVSVNGTTEIWDGDWKRNSDGTIKKEWTNNPAWVYFDLLTNKRYGLGRVLKEELIDKWNLFEIARYCDELVPDGFGGLEPRFTANIHINTQADAYQVINDFASIFRGLCLYTAGQIKAIADKPQAPIYTFTNANVIAGEFSYSSSAKKARSTICLVRYNDEKDMYKPSVVYAEDVEGIQKYGFRVKEMTAFGSSSKGQALRLAKWTISTERLETQALTFSAGIEAAYLNAGDIINVSDSNKGTYANVSARRRGGRSRSVLPGGVSTRIELDSSISGFLSDERISDNDNIILKVLTPPSFLEPITATIPDSEDADYIRRTQVQNLIFRRADVIHSGSADTDVGDSNHLRSIITIDHTRLPSSANKLNTTDYNITGFTGCLYDYNGVKIANTGFSENKPDDFLWAIEITGKMLDQTPDIETYRIVSIQEREGFKYSISAIQHDSSKFDLIDRNIKFDVPVILGFADPPVNLFLNPVQIFSTHAVKLRISFQHPINKSFLAGYKIFIKFGQTDFVNGDYTEDPEGKVPNELYFFSYIDKSVNFTDYLPYGNNKYHIRIYSINNQGKTRSAASFLGGSIDITTMNLLKDLEIRSLRLSSALISSNSAATKDSDGTANGNNFPVQWQAGFFLDALKEFHVPEAFTYRVTYRFPDQFSNTPTDQILFERTGIHSTSFQDVLYMEENLAITVPASLTGEVTPFRRFDIVVEAVDPSGFSSAGGTIIRNANGVVTQDALYNNYKGYDILYVDNPTLPSVHLTDLESLSNPEICESELPTALKFCTEQWMNEDGSFNWLLRKDENGLLISGDTRSAIGLFSKYPFTAADIPTKINNIINDSSNPTLDRRIVFNGGADALITSEGFSNQITMPTVFKKFETASELLPDEPIADVLSEMYVSLAFSDHFFAEARQYAPTKKNLLKTLKFSNVIKVLSRDSFLKDALLFRAWVTLNINFESTDVLSYQAAGIDQIEMVNYTAPFVTEHISRGGGGWGPFRRRRTSKSYTTSLVNRSARRFYFKDPLPSRGYEVLILFSPIPYQYGDGLNATIQGMDTTSSIQIFEKTKTFFSVKDMTPGGHGSVGPKRGTYFFAVLLGSLIHRTPGAPYGA